MKNTNRITPPPRRFCRSSFFIAFASVLIALPPACTNAKAPATYDKSQVGPQDDGRIIVPTNQVLTPAGRQVIVGGRPSDIALSPDGHWLAVLNLREVLL